jgi:hypothetical protein
VIPLRAALNALRLKNSMRKENRNRHEEHSNQPYLIVRLGGRGQSVIPLFGNLPGCAPGILALPKILSLQFPLRAVFSMKSNWALGCTYCSDERNAVRHGRDCDAGLIDDFQD